MVKIKEHKKKIIIILIILGLGYFGYTKFFSSNNSEKLGSGTNFGPIGNLEKLVEKKDFESSLSLKGTTKIKNEQKLRFNTAGRVLEVNYKVGDEVKLGQTLAKIDSNEISTEIERARLNLENAQDSLKKFVDDINNTGLKKSNLNIESAKIELDQKEYNINYLKKKQERDLKEAIYNLENAKNNFEISKKETKKNISNLGLNSQDRDKVLKQKELELSKTQIDYDDFKNNFEDRVLQKVNEYFTNLETNYLDLEKEVRDINNKLEEDGKLVGLNSDNEKVSYDTYFSAKNSTQIGIIKGDLINSFEKYREFKKSFEAIKDKKDAKNIIKALEAEKSFYTSYYKTANSIAKGYKDSIVSEGFSPSSYESSYLSAANSASSKMTSLTKTIDDLKIINSVEKIKKDLKNEFENKKIALENLKLEIKKTKENQDYIVGTSDNNIEAEKIKIQKSENSIALQELELEKLKKTQKDELSQAKIEFEKLKLNYEDLLEKKKELTNLSENNEYKLKKNAVKDAEVSLENAQKKLENYILKAPFDGKITKVDMKVGDRLNSDTQKFISISDPDSIEVNISVNQSDITKIKKGMKAEVKMNSYPNKIFSGTVLEVDTTPKEESGITKFDAKIVLEKPKDIQIYSGLKAEVSIMASKIEDAIIVPFTAVETGEDGKRYVKVIKDGKNEKREVEVGFTDGKIYEIKKGLEKGEKVLEIDYEGASDLKSKNTSIDGLMGGGEVDMQGGKGYEEGEY